MGFRNVNGKSQVEHTPSAILTPIQITGSGPWTVSARVVDNSTFTINPAEEVALGDIITAVYASSGDRRIASYIVDAIVSASGNLLTVQVSSIDDPVTLSFPYGNSTIGKVTALDDLRFVEGEPEAIKVAKFNTFIENLQQSTGGGVTWAQSTW